MDNVTLIREAIIQALPSETSSFGESPDQRRLYTLRAHVKALQLESSLVVGARGVGKSFWTAALSTPVLRTMLGASVRELDRTQVHVGFAVNENVASYPNMEIIEDLLSEFTPYEIWRAVVLRALASIIEETFPSDNWRSTVAWVKENPEPLAKFMQKVNETLQGRGKRGLLLFDALDRSSNDWRTMDEIVRDLLRVVLWLKSYPALHAKVFLREDQFARTVTDFPDASKLLATKSELTWQPHDLHGLLWQFLFNAPGIHGQIFREFYTKIMGKNPEQRGDSWSLHEEAKQDGPKQRALFESLAGTRMGKDSRRGVPYVWSVRHLADGKGQTSPRSFIAAIRVAADDSMIKYPAYDFALHYESIKRGVQKASEIRIAEIAEDYPWVKNLCESLNGLTVPCETSFIENRWAHFFTEGISSLTKDRLPPQHEERGSSGVMEDIERLGIFEKMKDGRINMPDLYRVGFGLGRRGGVKPMKRG